MLCRRAIKQHILKMEVNGECFNSSQAMRYNYEEAMNALNTLQSNAEELRQRSSPLQANATAMTTSSRPKSVDKMQGFLSRSHIDLNRLKSVIHIAGTKGKGSTCALTEQILRQHGYKTGFYSSPHLVLATERIRIDGEPLEKACFARTFWEVFTNLRQSEDATNLPIYFEMLTLMAFKCFIEEEVDVAIVEVGIGGQYDSTNVLRRVPVAGITSLGLDHTTLLGSTIEQVAWQKGGIMKPGSLVYTVPQSLSALEVLRKRSKEEGCSLEVVNASKYEEYLRGHASHSTIPNKVYRENTSLALQLAAAWMSLQRRSLSPELSKKALAHFCWPGRFQIIPHTGGDVFLDGAHTVESIAFCTQWFCQQIASRSGGSVERVLIFNSTGNRDVQRHLQILHECGFQHVYFVPNIASTRSMNADAVNNNCPTSEQLIKCVAHKRTWCELFPQSACSVSVVPSVEDALVHLQHSRSSPHATLITGSLHLVGSALQVLHPMWDAADNCAVTN